MGVFGVLVEGEEGGMGGAGGVGEGQGMGGGRLGGWMMLGGRSVRAVDEVLFGGREGKIQRRKGVGVRRSRSL